MKRTWTIIGRAVMQSFAFALGLVFATSGLCAQSAVWQPLAGPYPNPALAGQGAGCAAGAGT